MPCRCRARFSLRCCCGRFSLAVVVSAVLDSPPTLLCRRDGVLGWFGGEGRQRRRLPLGWRPGRSGGGDCRGGGAGQFHYLRRDAARESREQGKERGCGVISLPASLPYDNATRDWFVTTAARQNSAAQRTASRRGSACPSRSPHSSA